MTNKPVNCNTRFYKLMTNHCFEMIISTIYLNFQKVNISDTKCKCLVKVRTAITLNLSKTPPTVVESIYIHK